MDVNMSGATNGAAAALANRAASGDVNAVKYEPFVILEQRVELDLAFRAKQIKGTTTIKIFKLGDDLEHITLDARQYQIDKDGVTVNNQKVRVEYQDPYKLMDTPEGFTWGARQHHLRTARMKPLEPVRRAELPLSGRDQKGCQPALGSLRIWLRPDKIRLKPQTPGVNGPSGPLDLNMFEITIPFQTTTLRDGLQFVGVEEGDDRYPHAFTRHSLEPGYVSSLFPCVDDRTRVLQWRICLKFPRTVADVLGQPLASHVQAAATTTPSNKRNTHQRGVYVLTEEDKLLDMTAVCSGTLVGEHEDAEDNTKKVMEFEARFVSAQHIGFAVGPFEDVDLYSAYRSEEDEAKLAGNALKVHGYCLPHRREEVCNTCQPLANAADFFTLTFSKYPFDENSYKICFVDDMVEDTVPLQGFSLASSRLLYPDDVIETEIDVTRKLVHSIASQYFGVYISPNERTDTWIVVGLAYYMTDLYLRKLAGNNYFRFQMKMLATKLTEVDYNRPSLHELGKVLHIGDFEMDFMALKAPLVVFILDRRLMKSSNSSGVTRVMSQRLRESMTAENQNNAANFVVSSEQFRRQCERKGRLRLEDFWDQWVFGAGCPRFHVTQRFNKKRLEVEVTVIQNQVKWAQEPHQLVKKDFWRDIVEERYKVEASEVPLTFTGPMTFRVHEADGTPYEHCLEIKLDAAATKGSRLSMPYNTKYKRIKRTRQNKRAKEQAKAAARDPDRMDEDGVHDEEEDQSHSLSMFGDVLISDEDMATWKLVDWDNDMQNQMDQESYEWIRVDCDFEWIFDLQTNFKVYMTVAQLQQDRDVAGQVESMLTLTRNAPSNIQTTMLLRTLYDNRYFYGIRTMAAKALTRHAEPANNFRGMHHLIRIFKKFFCYPDTTTPRPNDFSNKKEFYVQEIIPMALARIRGGQAFCPKEARQLILDQLVFNNNEENAYSDQFYVAKLLEALATSLIRASTNGPSQAMLDPEMRFFIEKALEQIQRYENMDEWIGTHDNVWVVAALDAKMKLMKSGLIPVDPKCFAQYTLPQNNHSVQIKAFEAMIELGFLLRPTVMRLILAEISTNRSPYVRDQLFKLLTRGLAAIAFGEMEIQREASPKPVQSAAAAERDADGDVNMEDDDDGDLIVEQSDDVIKRRQEKIARQKDISTAIKALKDVVEEDEDLQRELWKALDSKVIGLGEKRNLLQLCATLFPEEHEMMVTMKYPARWEVSKTLHKPGRWCVLHFKQSYKTELKKRTPEPAVPTASPAVPVIAPAASAPIPAAAPAPAPAPAPPPPPPPPSQQQQQPRAPLPSPSIAAAVSNTAPSIAAPSVPILQAPVLPAAKDKPEKPKNKMIKISRTGTFSKPSVPPTPSTPSVGAPAPPPPSLPRQPSIAVAKPRPAAPPPEREASIAAQPRPPSINLPSAPPSATSSPKSTEHSRPIAGLKSAKIVKKRKLGDTDLPPTPSRSNRKMVTMRYRRDRQSEGLRRLLARIPSSVRKPSPVDSITASSAARARVQATSPLPRGPSPHRPGNHSSREDGPSHKASFTSQVSAGSASQSPVLQPSQRTPLLNGKIRRPLPTGAGGSGSPPSKSQSLPTSRPDKLNAHHSHTGPASPALSSRSNHDVSSSGGGGGHGSNKYDKHDKPDKHDRQQQHHRQPEAKRKVVKLKLGTKALREAASRASKSRSVSQQPPLARPQMQLGSPAPSSSATGARD
ncbi:hypothetical protein BD289DRAFT_123639 [Coniella lustricola]|uniref:Transcription initiation factor TFIID subunit 2 n=1 Tax=Coniella lustricola TaxID=2025994 RepID=A0A2T2ZWG1_9PEZI|nr:hypothetical protein BD289DRAFT_123639 [Coniella lustricola]